MSVNNTNIIGSVVKSISKQLGVDTKIVQCTFDHFGGRAPNAKCDTCLDKAACDRVFNAKWCNVLMEEMKMATKSENLGSSESSMSIVNDPTHYKQGTFEVIDEMILAFGADRTYDFCIMNAWKYRARAPYKGNAEIDMQKADRYMQMAYRIAENEGYRCSNPKLIKACD